MISKNHIVNAYALVKNHIRKTPIITTKLSVDNCIHNISFKCDFMQYSGSFKGRGAFYNILSQKPPEAGVAAASGGNHGAAVAYAAKALGYKAHIFVPETSSPAKIAKIKSYNADITIEGQNYQQTIALCDAYCETSGAINIHAFETDETILGQSTFAYEWTQQSLHEGASPIDTVIVAVGGGGLIAGACVGFENNVKIIGVEPKGAPTLNEALLAGKPVQIKPQSIAADSLGASIIGQRNLEITQNHVHSICVADQQIKEAQQWLWNNLNIIAEPGGATAFAALLFGEYKPEKNEHIGILLCGGNVQMSI